MTTSFGKRAITALALLGVTMASSPSLAATSPEQRAAAEALFQRAAELMDQKNFGEACEKFAASQELDPGLGTLLYLADCYDQAGKTASAWALFREAAAAAHRAGQADREQIAKERADNLQARLSRLELRVPKHHAVAGLELRLNDVAVPQASWNAALPVDPGPARVQAQAPGKKPWTMQITVEPGATTRRLELPLLQDAPRAAASSTSVAPDHPAAGRSKGSAQRTVGYVVGVTGLLALATGGFFGYRAYALNQESKGKCRSDEQNACSPEGVTLREDATTSGTISTITMAAGGVLLGGGIVLVLTAPSAQYASTNETHQASLPLPGFSLQGVW